MGALTVRDFCRTYAVGSTYAYNLIRDGVLDARKAGKRTLISRETAEAWFASLSPLHAGDSGYGRSYGTGAKQRSTVQNSEPQHSHA